MGLVGTALLLLLAACTSSGLEPLPASTSEGRVGPAKPDSVILRETEASDAELYHPPAGSNDCVTDFTTYGTHASPEDVTSYYDDLGFRKLGEGGRLVDGYRWAGEYKGEGANWRKVDIADGRTAGNAEWETVYEVFAPACDKTQSPGGTPTPA